MRNGYIPPQPNPTTEARVREHLKRMDELLDIRWQPAWVFNTEQQQMEGRYVLIAEWPYSDPRRARWDVHRGDTFDILGAFTTDVSDPQSTPADPESVLELVVKRLGEADGTRMPHLKRMKQVAEHNQRVRDQQKAQVLSDAEAVAADEHMQFVSRVYGGTGENRH
jgi:hypothetical protein